MIKAFRDTARLSFLECVNVKEGYDIGREPPGCKKHVFLFKPLCCEQPHGSFIVDSMNFSMNTSSYLTFLRTPELIMMCRVLHLSTFRQPVDNALWAHCRRRVFFIDSKKLCLVPFRFVGQYRQILSNLKIILNH